jgi:hypothetical protein
MFNRLLCGIGITFGTALLVPTAASAAVLDSYTFDTDSQGLGAPQFDLCPITIRPTVSGPFDGTDGNPAGSATIRTTTLASSQRVCHLRSFGSRRTSIDPARNVSLRWQEKNTVSGLSPLGGNTIGGSIIIRAYDADGNFVDEFDTGTLLVNTSTPWTTESTSFYAGSDARTIDISIAKTLRFDSPLSLLVTAAYAVDNLTISQ